MKKDILIFVMSALLFLFFINTSMAITSDIKNEYNGLETALVKIEGNIIEPITKEQIEFKRRNVIMPIEFDVKKIYETNYIWFITPRIENQTNYTLIIRNVLIQEFGQNKKTDIYLNFSVKENVTDYYITPGFISTKEDYTVTVNSNIDSSKKINIDFPYKQELVLSPGKNTFDFNTDDIEESIFKIVKFGQYNLPVYIIREGPPMNAINNTISISPQKIDFEREIGSNKLDYSFKIINVGGNKIEGLSLKYDDDYIKITPDSKINLESGEEKIYNLTLEKEVNISQTIIIYSDKNNISKEIEIDIKFVDFYSPINYTFVNQTIENNNSQDLYCQELSGKECFETQKCEGQIIKTKNNISCCIGKCALIPKESNSSWIGYLIIVIALVSIVFVFIKYKKVKPSKTFLEKTLEENKENKKHLP